MRIIPENTNLIILLAMIIIVLVVALAFVFSVGVERKRVIDQIRTRVEENRKLLGDIPGGIGVFDITGDELICTYINDGFKDIIGSGAFLAFYLENPLKLICPEDVDVLRNAVKEAKNPGDRFDCDVRFRREPEARDEDREPESFEYRWVNIKAKNVSIEHDKTQFYAHFTDIDERVRAQKKIEEADATIAAALDVSNVTYWEYYPKQGYTLEGAGSQQNLGIERRMENYPESFIERGLIHPDHVQKLRETIREIDEGADNVSMEILEKYKDGSYHWDLLAYRSIYDEEGERIKVVGTCRDVSTRKALESQYSRLMDAMIKMNPSAICSFRLNLTTNWVGDGHSGNDVVLSFAKKGSIDEFFKEALKHIPISERSGYRNIFNREKLIDACMAGETTFSYEHHSTIGQYKGMWMKTVINMAPNPTNGDVEAVIMATDINDSKINEAVFSETVVKDYDTIIYADIDTGMYSFFVMDRIENREDLFADGISAIEKNGETVDDSDRDRMGSYFDRARLRRAFENRSHFSLYYAAQKRHSKRRKKIRFSLTDPANGRFIITVTDVTDVYMQEQEKNRVLEKTLAEAKEANNAKTDFLARMSHDIRTPMNGVIGMTRLALEERDPEKMRGYLSKIDSSANFLLGLINDVLDMSKIESGNLTLNFEKYPPEEFSRYIDAVFSNLCEQKNITLTTSGISKNHGVYVDKLRFNQIFFNLLSNAVKFTPAGGTIELKFDDFEMQDDGRIRFRAQVKDTGIGMSEEFKQRMFEPFSQERTDMAGGSGTGLGLAIVNRLVDLLGGTISVESKPGEGTTFTLIFTLKAFTMEEGEAGSESAEGAESDLAGRRILLCEDNEINAEIAMLTLEKAGMIVDWAKDGREGIDMYRKGMGIYDAILMDIRMPVMDGLEAAREIRSLDVPDSKIIPIIALTANAFSDDVEESRKVGMNAHLSKPFEPETVYETLSRAIDEVNRGNTD